METCSDAVMVSQAQAHHDHQSIRSDAADDDDDGESERERKKRGGCMRKSHVLSCPLPKQRQKTILGC
jgi:hypothetical protein